MDLVGVTEIGKMLGVSRQRADQLSQADDFPKPAGRVGSSGRRVWRRTDVKRWARRQGRL